MGDIGYIALFLALVASIYSAIAFIIGQRRNVPALIQSARNSLLAVCGLVTISVGILLYSLLTHNFHLEYVYSYTSRDLPVPYLISALWAGNEGSLLFWAWVLTIFAVIMVLQRRDTGKSLLPYASAVTMITEAFFLILMLALTNPFFSIPLAPPDGRGLNPLLENPGMIIHPPLILMGYVGFTIPFAFAIAALISNRLGDDWLIAIRKWMLLTWLFLGVGNLIGAWWAYVELGWGGYWAWDPVENAGLMPWLVATAFLHSIMMQRRRGMLKMWNMVLIILAFILAIFGTFLTRSGILSSVHTFGDSAMGPFFMTFIIITLVVSVGMLFYRNRELKSEAEMEALVSRESTFLLNNLLLVGATFAIFIGTIFPVISEAVRGVKISVGPPFFNQVNAPIFLAIILLAGICTLIGWRKASIRNLIRHFLWPLLVAILTAVLLFIFDIRQFYALVAFPICVFVISTIFTEWFRGVKARHRIRSENYVKAFINLIAANAPRYGGYIVHIAIILITIGIVGSSLYDVEKDATLKPGESVSINNYSLTYDNIDSYETESKVVVTTTMSVRDNGKLIARLSPEKYFHRSYDQPVTEVAIRSTLKEDLYVILLGWEADGSATFKVLVNPLIKWMWIGAVVLVLGGVIAFWPETRPPLPPEQVGRRRQGK